MRKTAIALLALGLVAFIAAPASASTLMSETFPYVDGNLAIDPSVSGGNWTSHSGTSGADIQVVSGEAVVSSAAAYDDNRAFTAQDAEAKTYACFKLKISGTQTTSGTYFAHFKNTGTYFCAQTFAYLNDETTFNLGISSTSSVSATWPTPLNKDQWYTVAIMYDAATGISKLWVDPTSEASASVSSAVGYTGTLVSAFALRQSGGFGVATIDDLGVGTTFEDACPGATPASSTTWGRVKTLYR